MSDRPNPYAPPVAPTAADEPAYDVPANPGRDAAIAATLLVLGLAVFLLGLVFSPVAVLFSVPSVVLLRRVRRARGRAGLRRTAFILGLIAYPLAVMNIVQLGAYASIYLGIYDPLR